MSDTEIKLECLEWHELRLSQIKMLNDIRWMIVRGEHERAADLLHGIALSWRNHFITPPVKWEDCTDRDWEKREGPMSFEDFVKKHPAPDGPMTIEVVRNAVQAILQYQPGDTFARFQTTLFSIQVVPVQPDMPGIDDPKTREVLAQDLRACADAIKHIQGEPRP